MSTRRGVCYLSADPLNIAYYTSDDHSVNNVKIACHYISANNDHSVNNVKIAFHYISANNDRSVNNVKIAGHYISENDYHSVKNVKIAFHNVCANNDHSDKNVKIVCHSASTSNDHDGVNNVNTLWVEGTRLQDCRLCIIFSLKTELTASVLKKDPKHTRD